MNELREELLKKLSANQKGTERRINELISTHLQREGLIGPGEDCTSQTLIDYTMNFLPSTMDRIKATEE